MQLQPWTSARKETHAKRLSYHLSDAEGVLEIVKRHGIVAPIELRQKGDDGGAFERRNVTQEVRCERGLRGRRRGADRRRAGDRRGERDFGDQKQWIEQHVQDENEKLVVVPLPVVERALSQTLLRLGRQFHVAAISETLKSRNEQMYLQEMRAASCVMSCVGGSHYDLLDRRAESGNGK